jgi:hypothetical protein
MPRWAIAGPLTFCLILSACQAPSRPVSETPAGPSKAEASGPTVSRDLAQDEAAGGHTLKKHVGRTDEQLQERLMRERNIAAASTYTDRSTAEHAVGVALQENHDKIDRWLARPGGHPNLVLDYDGSPSAPIGRTLRRGQSSTEPCSHAVVVLKWDGGSSYHVLTSYPECRS